MANRVKQGQIVEAEVLDPAGGNKKRRPVVVLTPDHEIAQNSKLLVVAISTQIDSPMPQPEGRTSIRQHYRSVTLD